MANNYPDFIVKLQKNDPKLCESVSSIFNLSMSPGELDAKTKILIVLALDALHGTGEGVRVLSKTARNMGLSDNQIIRLPKLLGWPILSPAILFWMR